MSTLTYNRWLSVITLLLLTANIITWVLLWSNKNRDRRDKQPPPAGQALAYLTNELKLDASQQEAYKKLRDEHRAGERGIQDSIRNAKDNLFKLLQLTDVSDSTIQGYSKKIGEAEQQRDVLTFKHFQKLRALCNKEQQNLFDSIIQEVLRNMGQAKGPQGPPPPQGDRVEGPGNHRPPPPPENEDPPPMPPEKRN